MSLLNESGILFDADERPKKDPRGGFRGRGEGFGAPRINLPIDEIVKLYKEDEWSTRKIGEKHGVTDKTIGSRLREAGVEMRIPGGPGGGAR